MSNIDSLAALAPWGASLPHPNVVMSADELARRGDDSQGYELIAGSLVKMPPTDFDHAAMTAELTMVLRIFVKAHHLGTVLTGEPGFLRSRNPDTILAPDVAFVRTENAPATGSPQRKRRGSFTIIPDFVVEVASPSQHKPEMSEKAQHWLAAGVARVWVIWQKTKQIDVWQAGTQRATTLHVADHLDGGVVLPGFRYPVADLFA